MEDSSRNQRREIGSRFIVLMKDSSRNKEQEMIEEGLVDRSNKMDASSQGVTCRNYNRVIHDASATKGGKSKNKGNIPNKNKSAMGGGLDM
ncbi:formylmethanofuran dehydrogenase subunit C [Sesbania bispinosa]|nr:formylmethanofuran dehydrogenase subunit C [Sesbania bispinosa]